MLFNTNNVKFLSEKGCKLWFISKQQSQLSEKLSLYRPYSNDVC